DVIARRMRLAMLNAQAAKDALPRVIEIMAQELSWSKDRQKQEFEGAIEFLKCMGLQYLSTSANLGVEDKTYYTRNHFVPEELERYQREFHKLDYDRDGRIRLRDLSKVLYALGESSSEGSKFVTEDVKTKGVLEFGEFLDVLSDVKEARQRKQFAHDSVSNKREDISISRSGGGV
ncbi:glycerol-3-phosphate dehydrogenase, partial [Entophlyctis sp. JEL0112]